MSGLVNNSSAGQRYNFRYFPSKEAIIQAHEDALEEINRIWRGGGRRTEYVSATKYAQAARRRLPSGVTIYENPTELNESLEKFDDITSKIDMGGSFKKSRLIITADQRGIFSFGIASKGLFKPQEFFSEDLAVKYPNEFDGLVSGIVPAKFIEERESKVLQGEKEFWYKSKSGDYFQCTQQQEGKRDVELGLRKNLVYRTTTKKSYVMFEKKGGKAKMVELYLPVNQGFEFYNLLPLLLVARYLKISGIATRISVIRMFDSGSTGANEDCPLNNQMFGWTYPIKNYGDDFDYNDLALNGVDTRWWYNIYTFVKSIADLELIRANNNIDERSLLTAAGGYPSSVAGISDLFSRYRNWYLEEIDAGRIEPVRVDKKLLIVGGVNSNGSDIAVLREFYRIIDTIDLQFNTVDAVCKRVYERTVTDELESSRQQLIAQNTPKSDIMTRLERDKQTRTDEFKRYMTQLLTSTYSYPTQGQYPEPAESAAKLDEEFDEKIDQLTTFLNNV